MAANLLTIDVRWRYKWWVTPLVFSVAWLRRLGVRIDPNRVALCVARHGVVCEIESGRRWRRI